MSGEQQHAWSTIVATWLWAHWMARSTQWVEKIRSDVTAVWRGESQQCQNVLHGESVLRGPQFAIIFYLKMSHCGISSNSLPLEFHLMLVGFLAARASHVCFVTRSVEFHIPVKCKHPTFTGGRNWNCSIWFVSILWWHFITSHQLSQRERMGASMLALVWNTSHVNKHELLGSDSQRIPPRLNCGGWSHVNVT